MSRVFEALQKAGEEKKGEAIKPEVVPPVNGQADTRLSVEAYIPAVGEDHQPREGSFPPTDSGAKPWREWFEEVLFGWDLRRYRSYPIVAIEKDSAAAEQYKIFREQLKRLRNETGARSFAITSPVKQDGKTIVSVNLAAAMALGFGEQVLLIDGDLRSPDMHRYFGLQRSPGLTEYLTGANSNIVNYVQETFLPGLSVLTAGKACDLTSELLAQKRMKTLMEEVRSAFPNHQILVDTPPVLSTADPLILAREVEGLIIVVRARKTPRDHLLKAIQYLNSDKLMGIVLNGAEMGIAAKYYHYYSSDPN